jgi:hypothetical protein
LCPCVVVVELVEEDELFPPQPAIETPTASAAASSMAVSGVLLMADRTPFVALQLGRPPYQPTL